MTAIPLPDPGDPLSGPHWRAGAEGRLAMQRCDACSHVRWPAANSCPECLTHGSTWTTLSGRGTIWSFAVYETALHPAFAQLCPYAVALIRLDEGPMVHGRILDPPDKLACGQAVLAEFETVAENVGIARYRLVPADGA